MRIVGIFALIFCFTIAGGVRQGELLDGELSSNDFTDLNRKFSVDANVTSGVCQGKASPPSCCCVPVYGESACHDLGGSLFYPDALPGERTASETRTCHSKPLCCHQAASGKCASEMLVTVMKGENKEKHSQVYVKVDADSGTGTYKTGVSGGSGESSWNEEFAFGSIDQINVEVKWKKTVYGKGIGAGSYGTFTVMPKFWLASADTVQIKVPQFGMLTLQIKLPRPPHFNLGSFEMAEEYDSSLCIPGNGQCTELDALTDNSKKSEPVFLQVLNHRPNQLCAGTNFMPREYTVLIDQGESMSQADMKQIEDALQYLVPFVVAEDPKGVEVRLDGYDDNVCDGDGVAKLFERIQRKGAGGMGKTLAEALLDEMESRTIGRARTIFVFTDAQSSDHDHVAREIIAQTKGMCKSDMLSISFIQVGSNPESSLYLKSLDEGLVSKGAQFDIVDAVTKSEMEGKSFLDIVKFSLHD